jgi:hypothetical protein
MDNTKKQPSTAHQVVDTFFQIVTTYAGSGAIIFFAWNTLATLFGGVHIAFLQAVALGAGAYFVRSLFAKG